jgi:hypothetical protein
MGRSRQTEGAGHAFGELPPQPYSKWTVPGVAIPERDANHVISMAFGKYAEQCE